MSDNVKKTYVTPPMNVEMAFLSEPATKYNPDGDYLIKVTVKEGTEAEEYLENLFEELLDEMVPEATKQLKPAQKKKLVTASPLHIQEDEEGEETGYKYMTFSMPAVVTRKKDGKQFFLKPALFDAKGNPMTQEQLAQVRMGRGSVVRVSFDVRKAYCKEGEDMEGRKFHKAGLSIDLKGVKILKVVPFEGAMPSAESCGFDDDDEGDFSVPSFDGDINDGGDDAPMDGDF